MNGWGQVSMLFGWWRRKVVRVLGAHKVQRHLRQRALEVSQAPYCAANGASAELHDAQPGMKKHRAGASPFRCLLLIL